MAARSTADTTGPLALHDLRACEDVSAIFRLFRMLGYPVADTPIAVHLEDDELPGRLRERIVARYPVAQVGDLLGATPPVMVTLFALRERDPHSADPYDATPPSAVARAIAQTWARRFVGQHLLVFALLADATDPARHDERGASVPVINQLLFMNARRLGEGADVRIQLYKLAVERRHPTRHDVVTLNGIALTSPQMSAKDLYAAQCKAFDVERMTDAFYREYAERFRAAMRRIKDDNRGIAAFQGDSDAPLHTFTQRLFGRLLFLYFLQKKGALNHDPNFITTWYHRVAQEEGNYYLDALEPLFFETLNRPRANNRSSQFGEVPYLNGGLFAEDEDDQRGQVYLANDIFDPKGDQGLLYFLNNHNFTVEEDTPLDVQVALDPEMLGKVFENQLEADERGKSGTFYTPRSVVAFMCREALAAYLGRAVAGLDDARLGWLLDEAETGEPARDGDGHETLTYATLSHALRERIERALQAVRVLDPAVGSGAFPLGMLALLVGVRRALFRITGVAIAPPMRAVEEWKRVFVRDCLYGVDIRREAIEIARLRLWLSLVVDADPFTMDPLPNLDYKLMDGDSLIETFDGVEIFPTRPPKSDQPQQVTWGKDEEQKTLIARLHELQDEWYQPEGQIDRVGLRQRIRETEVALVEARLRERQRSEESRLKWVVDKLAGLQGKPQPREVVAEQAHLTHSIDMTDQALVALRSGQSLPFFLYRLHFAPVFAEKDGFDIVIANPPYVRHEKVPPATLATLKTAYPDVAHGMADLYVYFYARALELLRPQGTFCYISSNKFFRAGYGAKLRETLTTATSLRLIVDFGDYPVFDAAAYPCIVIGAKGAPTPDHTYRGLTAGPDLDLTKLAGVIALDGQTLAQADGARPPAGGAATDALVARLLAMGTPLGQYVGGRMYRGVVTGLNEAFVVDQATRDRLIAEAPRSAEVLRPYLRGRDINRYAIHPAGLWLIFTRHGTDITRYPAIERYLSQFQDDLAPRQEKNASGPGRKPGHYKWYEIQDSVDYYAAFEGSKIVFPDIAPEGEFAWDESGSYIGNTSYCIPTSHRYLSALLNSRLTGYVYASLSPQVRGGYFRFIYQYMERLPIVEPSAGDQARLAELVGALQAVGGVGPGAAALEAEVDAIMYRVYGLSAAEVAEVERWHAERRALVGGGKGGKGKAALPEEVAQKEEGEEA